MTAYDIIFYLLAAFILGNGILAMTTTKIFRAAIFLLFTLIGVAGLYFWLAVEFVAAVQIIVYVGGIVVLIIFSIFLTQHSGEEMPDISLTRKISAAIAVLCGAGLTSLLVFQHQFASNSENIMDDSPQNIGTQMLDYQGSGFALPFEVISILLLAAMIGAIVIALKTNAEES